MWFLVCLRQSEETEILGNAKLNGQQQDLNESQIHVGELKAKRWGKGKFRSRTSHEGLESGLEVALYSFFKLGTRLGGWSTPRTGRFTPGKDPVPIV
jgi:hypothetical protein